jgi:hypothetical protein
MVAPAVMPRVRPMICFMRGLQQAYVSIRQHTSAYVSILQHTSAYVSFMRGLPSSKSEMCQYL